MNRIVFLSIIGFIVINIGQIQAQCNAGDDATFTVCENDTPFNLFDRINGTPIAGGFWLDAVNAPITSTFDPMTDGAGLYKYVVDTDLMGAPCALNDTAFLDISISSIPVVTFNMDNNQACGELTTQFTNTTIGLGFTNCLWSFGDGEISTVCNPSHIYSESGCFDVALTLTNGAGCAAVDTVFAAACVYERPVAAFDLEKNPVLTTEARAVFINQSTNGVAYEWIIPGVGNFNEEEPIVVLPPLEDTYFVCLQVTAANGCEDSYCSNVLVREDVVMYIPTAFTPNLDQVNETFKPQLTFTPELYELTIYDRWGTVVFKSLDPAIGWNGGAQGSSFFTPDSYYSYRIKAVKNAEVIERVGQIMMLR